MRLTIPLTGKVLDEVALIGDTNDPIRPVELDLGNVSWQMVDIDLDNEVMMIEVEPSNNIAEPTGELNDEGEPAFISRQATDEEKIGFLQHAQDLVMNHTKSELYQISKCSRLRRPFKEKK